MGFIIDQTNIYLKSVIFIRLSILIEFSGLYESGATDKIGGIIKSLHKNKNWWEQFGGPRIS